jgi:hypothetical protein
VLVLGCGGFDTANAYAGGRSEEWIGRWLASRSARALLAAIAPTLSLLIRDRWVAGSSSRGPIASALVLCAPMFGLQAWPDDLVAVVGDTDVGQVGLVAQAPARNAATRSMRWYGIGWSSGNFRVPLPARYGSISCWKAWSPAGTG